ncbi:MAG TPA: glycosyltransferase [Acidimicrobiales bacterium]|nr:glycosyltransferase [Acidimicrobiales bacterium]
MGAIHQFLPTFASRDAIGTHALHARRILRGMGLESEIYAEGIPRPGRRHAHPYRTYGRRPSPGRTWLLYQLSTGSAVADFLRARPEPKLVNYHNVTTAALFAPWEPHVAVECTEGRRQLRDMAGEVDLGIAVSAYNEAELREAGYKETAVAPVLVDLDSADVDPDPEVLARLERARRGGGATWLFVGRVAPHKCQHDVVRALAVYRRLYDPDARLHLVGGAGSGAYVSMLERYVASLGLAGAVTLPGSVPAASLRAYFRSADVFVCLSEHEGFCVPIIEAMRLSVPVVAFASTAVPETAAGAGVLLEAKDAVTVAAAVWRVLGDSRLRADLVAAGTRRAADFSLANSSRRFTEVIAKFLAGQGAAS